MSQNQSEVGGELPYAEMTTIRQQRAEKFGQVSRRVSAYRALAIAAALVLAISATMGKGSAALGWSALAAFVGFVVLVVWHAKILNAEDRAWRMWRVAHNANERGQGNWHAFPENGSEFSDGSHAFSGDLDVFGPESLFQYFNVAHTRQGQSALASHLSEPGLYRDSLRRQEAAKEMAEMLEFRQTLESHTLTSPEAPGVPRTRLEPLDLMTMIEWAESAPRLKSRQVLRAVCWALPCVTISAMLGSYFSELRSLYWQLLLTVQIFVCGAHTRAGAEVFGAIASSPGVFARLRPTLQLIESQTFRCEALVELQQHLGQNSEAASVQMTKFERVLSWFELRRNGMVYPLINALLLWDVHCLLALEEWQKKSGTSVRTWLSTLGEWEALSSLAGLAHDNPEFHFPELCSEGASFDAKDLAHPLLRRDLRIGNDVALSGAGSALLVTGSNMSGKSTLLRSMGLAVVLGRAGAPVCAKSLKLSCFSLHTSMRISDSLSAGVSHFYAELGKLQSTLQATDGEAPVFFLLDEILHGTNSNERQIGARWILSQLIDAGATGAVSTHDLALCELPTEWMSKVRTVHLRETVSEGKMSFDYQLREGPVRGGNALLLMRSLGLEVPLSC